MAAPSHPLSDQAHAVAVVLRGVSWSEGAAMLAVDGLLPEGDVYLRWCPDCGTWEASPDVAFLHAHVECPACPPGAS